MAFQIQNTRSEAIRKPNTLENIKPKISNEILGFVLILST
jgi:hypothetical protein